MFAMFLALTGLSAVVFADAPASAIVNFGKSLNTSGAENHILIPDKVTIRRGGIVNFIVSGFHQIVVYESGIDPEDIDTNSLDGPLIDDPVGRIYRGLDPRGDDDPNFEDANFNHNRNRIEAVSFDEPGCHLVICAVRGHFVNDNMFGFVCVEGDDDD